MILESWGALAIMAVLCLIPLAWHGAQEFGEWISRKVSGRDDREARERAARLDAERAEWMRNRPRK